MDIGDKVIKDIGEAYIVLHDRVPELEQEVTRWQERYQKATDEAFTANQVIVEYQSRVVELQDKLELEELAADVAAHDICDYRNKYKKLKKYLEKVYLHIAFEQDVPEGFYDWFDDDGKVL